MSDTIMDGGHENTDPAAQESDPGTNTDHGQDADKQPADDKTQGDKTDKTQDTDQDANKGGDDKDQGKDGDKADKDGDKSDGDKGDDDADEGKDGAPESYSDFQLAEGAEVNEAVLTDFKEFAKELNLTQDQAQKLVDFQQDIELQRVEAFQAEVDGWVDTAKTDKEFGGKTFDENVSLANEALKEFGTPELINFLRDTRAGNHPEVIRTFYRIGKQLKEGGVKRGSNSAGGPKKLTDIYD